ncbi:MAG: hypothetical protein IT367_06030 [Candidatus Hydrogenedentes bacterium]|nr:hypothetical protein [Candidatus Hydrogenedentota bacterium]
MHDRGTVYFLVSEITPAHNDSYILPLTDADDIAQARALIADPDNTPSKIVVASIAPCENCDYPNRDLLNDGQRWSWCIIGFEAFAENTIEIYDGWPTFVEGDLNGWIENTNGVIGFWAYTVTRELTPFEVYSGHLSNK